MIGRDLLTAGAILTLAIPTSGFAGFVCGIDGSLLPSIHKLDVDNGRLNAFVGPVTLEEDRSRTASLLVRDDNGDWRFQSRAKLPAATGSWSADQCMTPPPDQQWTEANKDRIRENPDFNQEVRVCVDGHGRRWGGISFYGGEGSWGVGGIVEEDTKTGATRYYRPRTLIDYSTSHLEFFGDRLWIGTAWYGECGVGVGVGVLSGEFANDELYPSWVMETCGFIVSDMVVHDDSLWIATEMGLSRVSKSGDRYKPFTWKNYVPTGNSENPMREITCDQLYAELFQSSDLASATPNDSGHPYGVLWHRVSKLRPNFAWQYVRRLNGLESPVGGERPE